MKKLLFATALLVIIVTNGFSQNAKFGVKGGLNIPKLFIPSIPNSDINFSNKSLISFYVGGLVESTIANKLNMQTELLYVQNGARILIEDADLITRQLNMPVSLKYEIIDGLFLDGGGYFGVILDVVAKGESTEILTSDFKAFDAGFLFGAEYNLPMGLFIDTRYNMGLLDIVKKDKDSDISGIKVYNRFFQIGIGYKF